MLRLHRLCRLPQRPSAVLGLADRGFSEWAMLDFDLAVCDYAAEFERRAAETVEVPAPKGRRAPTVPRPRYGEEALRRFLGIPEEMEEEASPAGGGAESYLTPEVRRIADDVLAGRVDWSAYLGEGLPGDER